MTFEQHIAQEAWWLQTWIYWLVVINTASILFAFVRQDAHWVLTAWLANLLIMPAIFDQVGYVRLLGLSHIIVWTPLLIYLYRRMQTKEIAWATLSGKYLYVLAVTNAISLVIDYVDLVRYLIGDGELA